MKRTGMSGGDDSASLRYLESDFGYFSRAVIRSGVIKKDVVIEGGATNENIEAETVEASESLKVKHNGLLQPVIPSNGYFNVVNYGAVGDGETDCTEFFDAAVAAMIANEGGTIFIPAGVFMVADWSIPAGTSHFRITGEGPKSVVKLIAKNYGNNNTDPIGAVSVQGTSGNECTNFIIENLTVDGNRSGDFSGTTSMFNIECVELDFCRDCILRDLFCVDSRSEGIDIDDCEHVMVDTCFVIDCDGWGIHLSLGANECFVNNCTAIRCGFENSRGGMDMWTPATNCVYSNCRVIDSRTGFESRGPRNTFENCVVENSQQYGFRFHANGDYGVIRNCTAKNCAEAGVLLTSVQHCHIIGYYGESNGQVGSGPGNWSDIFVSLGGRHLINGCYIRDATNRAIRFNRSIYNNITSNTIIGAGENGIHGFDIREFSITNNIVEGCGGKGIALLTGAVDRADRNLISGNFCVNNGEENYLANVSDNTFTSNESRNPGQPDVVNTDRQIHYNDAGQLEIGRSLATSTFNTVITDGTVDFDMVLSTLNLTKIGKLIFLEGRVQWSSKNSMPGQSNLRLMLPLQSDGDWHLSSGQQGLTLNQFVFVQPFTVNNASYCFFMTNNAQANSALLKAGDVNETGIFEISGFYKTK